MSLALLSNPRSRQNRRHPDLVRQLEALLMPGDRLLETESLEALEAAVAELVKDPPELLAISGGDGSTHAVLSAWVRQAPPELPLPTVVILRGGTMNTVARGLGIRGRPLEIMRQLQERRRREQTLPTVTRNLLIVNESLAGFLFGNGAFSNYLEIYYEGSEPSPMKAAWVLLKLVLSLIFGGALAKRISRRARCSVELADGSVWERGDWLSVGAGTVDDIGLGFKVFRLAPEHPDQLHVVGWGCSARQLLLQFPGAYRAQPYTDERIQESLSTQLILRGEEPLDFMIDGDFHRGEREVRVRVGPRCSVFLPQR